MKDSRCVGNTMSIVLVGKKQDVVCQVRMSNPEMLIDKCDLTHKDDALFYKLTEIFYNRQNL